MKAKRRHSLVLLLPALLCCTGCFDLGTLNGSSDNDFTVYYSSFEKVKAIYDDGGVASPGISRLYSIEESLCNGNTINSFKWEEGKEVEQQPYLYLVIQPTIAMNIDELMLYVRSDVANILQISSYYIADPLDLPTIPKFRGSQDTNPDTGEEIAYNDPEPSLSVCNRNVSVQKDTWTGFILSSFNQQGYDDKLLHMAANTYLYIRVDNNSGYYKTTTTECSFSFIDLIIRAV